MQQLYWISGVAAVLTIVIIAILLRWRHLLPLDRPNHRSLHESPIPRIGGLGIAVAMLCTWSQVQPWPILLSVCVAMLSAVSFIDDRNGLPASVRFVVHTIVSFVWLFALCPTWSVLALGLTAIMFVWSINLYNFMDGSDGLAAGMTLFGFGAYSVAATSASDLTLASIALTVAAAAGGFLLFNWHPAKVFLGDAGSVPLGFLAAALGLEGWIQDVWPWWFPLLVFSPFGVDATVTLARRAARGDRVWQPHREHFYQRMVQSGFGHKGTALRWYLLMAAAAGSAFFALHSGLLVQRIVIGVWCVTYALLIMWVNAICAAHNRKGVKH